MKLILYYSSTTRPLDKYDLTQMLSSLDRFKKTGIWCEIVDTSKMTDEEIGHIYIGATVPSVYRKYRVRQVFGSRRHSGWLFGKHVPALLVYDDGAKYPSDVYPHEKDGREVTIEEFLGSLLKENGARDRQGMEG